MIVTIKAKRLLILEGKYSRFQNLEKGRIEFQIQRVITFQNLDNQTFRCRLTEQRTAYEVRYSQSLF